jgi:hypothetical protein
MGNDCSLNKLTVATNMQPAGTFATFTVQTGTPVFNLNSVQVGSMVDTTLSCSISGSSTSCSATGPFQVTAGQFMGLKIVISNATTPAGYFGFWAIGCQ